MSCRSRGDPKVSLKKGLSSSLRSNITAVHQVYKVCCRRPRSPTSFGSNARTSSNSFQTTRTPSCSVDRGHGLASLGGSTVHTLALRVHRGAPTGCTHTTGSVMTLVRGTKGVARHLQNIPLARCLLVLTGIINNSCCSSQILLGFLTRGRGGGGHGSVFSRVHPDGPGAAASTALMGKPVAQPRKSSCLETPPWSQIPDAKSSLQTRAWGKIPAAKSCLAWSRSPVAKNRKHHHDKAKKRCSTPSWRGRGSRNPTKCFGDGNALLEGPAHPVSFFLQPRV